MLHFVSVIDEAKPFNELLHKLLKMPLCV